MKKFLIAFLLAIPVTYVAQERIQLATPETVPSNTNYRTERLILQEDDPDTSTDEGLITIQLLGVERKISVTCTYNSNTSPTGTFLLNALNKANFSSVYNDNATSGSLKQRIFHRLVVMNEGPEVCGRAFNGSISGTPQ